MPPVPQYVIQAANTFWNSPAHSPQGKQAMRVVADYCIKNKLHVWRLLDKVKSVKAITSITRDASLAQKAIAVAEEGIAEEGGALTAEGVAGAAVGEGAGGATLLGLSPHVLAAVVVVTLIVVILVLWAKYENDRLDNMGQQQDRQRQVEKGLRSVVPGAFQIDPGMLRAGRLG